MVLFRSTLEHGSMIWNTIKLCLNEKLDHLQKCFIHYKIGMANQSTNKRLSLSDKNLIVQNLY